VDGSRHQISENPIGKDTPIGAVLIDSRTKKPVGEGHAMDHITGDPRKHAEDVVIDQALEVLGSDFSECTLYTTAIPCVRCALALNDCNVGMILYGAEREQTEILRPRDVGPHEAVWRDGHKRLTVVAGLLAVEAAEILVAENRAPSSRA